MKLLFIVSTIFFSLSLTTLASAEWTKVNEFKGWFDHYVDFDRIRRHKDKTYYWLLTNLPCPGCSNDSYLDYVEAECGPFRQRSLTQRTFPEFFAKGKPFKEFYTHVPEWIYPSPYSEVKRHQKLEAVLEAVCKHKP